MCPDSIPEAKETCPECKGDGRAEPDCGLCAGRGGFTAKEITDDLGMTVDQFEKWDDDENFYECCECHDDSCHLCEGMGTVAEGTAKIERLRVLLAARSPNTEIPPRILESPNARAFINRDAYLSSAAAGELRHEGKIRWYCSIMGDELYLSDPNDLEVMAAFDDGTARFLSSDYGEGQ